MYRLAVRYETTTDRAPDEIHELGLAEVKRIQASYLAAARKAGFDGNSSEVHAWLRSKSENYPFMSAELNFATDNWGRVTTPMWSDRT
jgi:uncharacterized protein (DUF885 family)